MKIIQEFYEKYNEEKRLLSPYGRVEYLTTMKYLHDFIGERKALSVFDIGCATGRYAVPLSKEGHMVTAVDPVPYHVGILKQKIEKEDLKNLTVKKGDVLHLRKFPDESFDIILLFGPLYHLFSEEDKVGALKEAKRLLKADGLIFVSYIMNEFSIIEHGFKKHEIISEIEKGKVDEDFHIHTDESDLFSYDRLSDMDRYNEKAGLKSLKRLSQDGATNYMRDTFKEMSMEEFGIFMKFHFKTCEEPSLLGAANHVMDILKK